MREDTHVVIVGYTSLLSGASGYSVTEALALAPR